MQISSLTGVVERAVVGTRAELPARLLALRVLSVRGPRHRQSYWYKVHTGFIIDRVMDDDSCGVDVGAHRGLLLLAMMRAAPHGPHVAIEPVLHLAADLQRRFATVKVMQAAASDCNGTASFVQDLRHSGLSALAAADASGHEASRELQVETVTLDTALADRAVRFMKIDAMGAHLRVLRGARNVLGTHRPHCVFTVRKNAGLDAAGSADTLWDYVNRELDLRISTLRDWLAGRPHLSRQEFCAASGHHPKSEFYFLLHPQRVHRA